MVVYGKAYDAANGNVHKEQHLLGRELLKEALINEYGIEFSEDMIEKLPKGKPVLKDLPIYFSISHCRGMVVCAVADAPVGADVEGNRSITQAVIKKACDKQEQSYILKHDITKSFLELWTLKESYLKMTGTGMAVPFSNVNFSFKEEKAWEPDTWRTSGDIRCNQPGYFFQKGLPGGYVIALCSKVPCEIPNIIILS